MGVRGQAGQELADLGFAHFGRVPLPVEKDEALDPPDIRFLCSGTEMSGTHSLSDSVKQLELWRAHRRGNGHCWSPIQTYHAESAVDEAPHVGYLHGDLLGKGTGTTSMAKTQPETMSKILIRGSGGRAELDREGPEERAAAVEAGEPRLPGEADRLPVLFRADAAVDLGKLLARDIGGEPAHDLPRPGNPARHHQVAHQEAAPREAGGVHDEVPDLPVHLADGGAGDLGIVAGPEGLERALAIPELEVGHVDIHDSVE